MVGGARGLCRVLGSFKTVWGLRVRRGLLHERLRGACSQLGEPTREGNVPTRFSPQVSARWYRRARRPYPRERYVVASPFNCHS